MENSTTLTAFSNLDRIHLIKRRTVRDCIKVARKNSRIRRMIVFGSSVTEHCNENSDLDICLDITGSTKEISLFESVADMSEICDGDCDILIYSSISEPLKSTIDRNGVVVYELS